MTTLAWVGVGLTLVLSVVIAAFVVGLLGVSRDIKAVSLRLEELKKLSLNPRTRISQASMQSGATTPEQEGKRLAHASRARRVVVGGDDDSEQKRMMLKGIPVREEENDG